MERIHSFLIYPFLVLFPVLLFGAVYSFDYKVTLSTELIGPNLLIIFFAGLYVFTLMRYKRVYLKNSSLYVFNLFSTKHIVITKKNLVSIGRFVPFDRLNLKIVDIDGQGNSSAAYFMKNIFIWNLKESLKSLE